MTSKSARQNPKAHRSILWSARSTRDDGARMVKLLTYKQLKW